MNRPGSGGDDRAELLAQAEALLRRFRPERRRPVVPLTLGLREKLLGRLVRQQDHDTGTWFCGDCLADLPSWVVDQDNHVCAPGTEPAEPLPPVKHYHLPRDLAMPRNGEAASCWRCGQQIIVKWVPVATAEEALTAYAPSMIRIGFVLHCRLCGIPISTSHHLICPVWSPISDEQDVQ